MSYLVLGLSHRTASLDLLEQVSLDAGGVSGLLDRLGGAEHLREAMVLSTCNRIEVYADVDTFHGAVTLIGDALAEQSGVPVGQLRDHLYVHFEDRAVAHTLSLAAGLDSVAVGESQILGQLRDALRSGMQSAQTGPALAALVQRALRVGKRVHSETEIDSVSRSLIERALEETQLRLGDLAGLRGVVVGAGAMSGLAAHTLARAGLEVSIVNRTLERGERLAMATGGTAYGWDDLPLAMSAADVIVSCTGAVGHVISEADVRRVQADRQPRVWIDLALPRDIDPRAAEITTLLSLDELSGLALSSHAEKEQLRVVRDLVTAETAEFLTARRAAAVGPTVAALRERAEAVIDAEMTRLRQRTDLGDHDDAAVRQTLHRVVEKILHTPTVRMKELAADESGQDYTALLRALFDLDPHETRVSALPPPGVVEGS